ncbi:MAG TPA: hypothetical protein DCQ98_10050 [Planctomycetaceae bacterium]|nr:hypothetical protein [Planctomycetaceae bacterium]
MVKSERAALPSGQTRSLYRFRPTFGRISTVSAATRSPWSGERRLGDSFSGRFDHRCASRASGRRIFDSVPQP